MRISRLWAILASAALLLLAAPARSFADQFNFVLLGSDNSSFVGLSSNGTAYFDHSSTGLFSGYTNGVSTYGSYSAPTFTSDNGTSCASSAPTGTQFVGGRCNNGMDVFSAKSNSTPVANLYWGTTLQDIWGTGIGPLSPFPAVVALNSIGDIVFDDQSNDNWYEAIDLTTAAAATVPISGQAVAVTTPEPATLLLLSTGLLAPLVFLRRRTAATR